MLDVRCEELVADFDPQGAPDCRVFGLDRDDACLRFYETQWAIWPARATLGELGIAP
jgi:hypothetical protein